jgi:hypothetical protein
MLSVASEFHHAARLLHHTTIQGRIHTEDTQHAERLEAQHATQQY